MSIDLKSCKLQIKTKAGTLASGNDSVKSITLKGANQSADAGTLLAVSDAIESVNANPVLEVLRIDENSVTE